MCWWMTGKWLKNFYLWANANFNRSFSYFSCESVFAIVVTREFAFWFCDWDCLWSPDAWCFGLSAWWTLFHWEFVFGFWNIVPRSYSLTWVVESDVFLWWGILLKSVASSEGIVALGGVVPGVVACIFGGSISPGSEKVTDLDVTGLAFALVTAPPEPDVAVPLLEAALAAIRVASFTSWNFSMN